MKTMLCAALTACLAPLSHAGEPPLEPATAASADRDGVDAGRYETRDRRGSRTGGTYINAVDPSDGCGLGVTIGDDGRVSTSLITPGLIIVNPPR